MPKPLKVNINISSVSLNITCTVCGIPCDRCQIMYFSVLMPQCKNIRVLTDVIVESDQKLHIPE